MEINAPSTVSANTLQVTITPSILASRQSSPGVDALSKASTMTDLAFSQRLINSSLSTSQSSPYSICSSLRLVTILYPATSLPSASPILNAPYSPPSCINISSVDQFNILSSLPRSMILQSFFSPMVLIAHCIYHAKQFSFFSRLMCLDLD